MTKGLTKKRTIDLNRLRSIPILSVADALGLDLQKEGATWAMREGDEVTSLTFNLRSNRWKRWSGIERGGCSDGSVIDLYRHVRDDPEVKNAIEWLAEHFPSYT